MTLDRHSGILLHPTSLPGPHGAGDLGAAAYHFVDWLLAGKQSRWQILPLGGIGPGNSPYMSPSAFAGNELLIDLSRLREAGWLNDTDLEPDPAFRDERIDYPATIRFRMARLRLAAERFLAAAPGAGHDDFAAYCASTAAWLDDYALFMALDSRHGGDGKVWQDWPAALAKRQPKALQAAATTLADECAFWKFCQWCFATQWAALKHYANARGIDIIGDMPIFVSPHSADVWANQALFDLDDQGHPRVVAGVPPDYFSASGQRWGNPLYRWAAHAKEGYRWWIARMQLTLERCDIVRIDHFRGFESYWEIPASAPTAIQGQWKKGPGIALFDALQKALDPAAKGLPIIAEDLGEITPEVAALRAAIGLPGMRILQFAFDGQSDNLYLPHNFEPNTVVYTGTHDNDTSIGWWATQTPQARDYLCRYLGLRGGISEAVDGIDSIDAIHWVLIRAASASVASLSIIPLQDALGLDANSRMNQPGEADGYWAWRFSWNQVAAWHAERLGELCQLHGRLPKQTGRAQNDRRSHD